MGFSPKLKQQIEKKVFDQLKIRADQRLIPFLKASLRRDSGDMTNNTDTEVIEEDGKTKLRLVIGRGLSYPQFVEGRYGVFKDGTKAGAAVDEWFRMLVD